MEVGASAPLEQPLHSPQYLQKYSFFFFFFFKLFRSGMITSALEKSCIWEYYGERSTAPKEQPLDPPQYLQKYLGTLWKVEDQTCIQDYYGRWSICSLGATAPSSTISFFFFFFFFPFFFFFLLTSKNSK